MAGNSSSQAPLVSCRPASAADFEFLYALHRAALRDAVVATWGAWEEDWQRAHYQKTFSPAAMRVIRWRGVDVGVIAVQWRAEELFVCLLEVHPAHQGRGIGTAVMQSLIDQANADRKPVALKVLRANQRAVGFYKRFGFVVTGQSATHWIMAREPDPPA